MKKRRILIVDDEQDFLKLAKINLEDTGNYEVETMLDAREIISQVRSFKPDVILLDILMPKMDGVEVCRMLNQNPVVSGIPIITLTALDTDKDKLMMYKLGVVDFLVKPIETDQLITKIEHALQCK
jgi:two-component system, OmpR family, alkaline phosphatase synthesis response regulator PhoP